ncbi:hypothetical protein [Microtetraspora sp. NBRC 16547]|uniref:hypothetical protein n=1 Tax=Microtetraspora sp. NBRC 16547 TaxID=3030993 RepID=UPI0024A0B8EC|nr:hypothetical protein [Microtetraspora sp. NBRC 16547]GLX02748.1 hypothetical protein Misp02_68340 [Microtetraspora sp. NBRC 16547]
MSDPNGAGAEIASRSYPCQSCGASLEYAPGTSSMRCPYCKQEQPIAPAGRGVREHDYAELAQMPRKPRAVAGAAHAFVCPGCRARTESDTLSERCQFCGTPLVTDASTERIVPEAILPFGIDRDGARAALRTWTSSRWFAPSSLKKVTEAETFKGSYLPYWTYDARTVSDYTGQRGDHYWETETYTVTENGSTRTETRQVMRTRWSHASGTVSRAFDDVLVPGTSRVASERLDKLAPWLLDQAVPYQGRYLAGFQTVRYDIEPEDGLELAKERMATVIESDCRHDIGGDEQRVRSVTTRYFGLTYKLVLLPVWFLSYLHGGKTWQVMVNASTGEVIGQRPYSVARILAAVLAALAIVALIALIVVQANANGR